MTGEPLSGNPDPRPLDAALANLARSLESLRDFLRQRERDRAREAQAALGHAAAPPDGGGSVLPIVEEILALPAAGIEPQELFTLATDRISRLLGADRVMFFVADGHRLRPRSARGFRRTDLESVEIDAGDGIVGRAFSERRVLTEAGGIGGDADAFIERFPVKEAIAVPVRAEDDVVGVLYAGRRAEGRPFDSNDVLVLLVVADRMGGAFVHQALLDRCSASISRLTELAGFAGEAPLGRELTDVLSRACEVGCRLIGVRAAAVAVGMENLELVAARGLPRGLEAWRAIARREGLTAELYARDGPVACRDVQARRGAERSFLGEAGFHGCLLLPLRLRGLMLGVLYLADTEVRDFSVEEIAVAGVLAAMTASSIENSRVYAVLASGIESAQTSRVQDVEAEKARALAEIAAGIAREFNQIFAVVLGKSQLLLARAADDAVREGLGVIEEAAWRGADIVHRVGSLAAHAETTGELTDMKALAQDAVALARTRWKDEADGPRRIDITADLEPVPPVRGDEAALRDVVGHLVRNALDAMPTGGRLALALRPRDGGIELVIEDSGEGIAEEVKRRMFDPFFTTRAPARMGLGLTMVRSTVTRYGGRVDDHRRPRPRRNGGRLAAGCGGHDHDQLTKSRRDRWPAGRGPDADAREPAAPGGPRSGPGAQRARVGPRDRGRGAGARDARRGAHGSGP